MPRAHHCVGSPALILAALGGVPYNTSAALTDARRGLVPSCSVWSQWPAMLGASSCPCLPSRVPTSPSMEGQPRSRGHRRPSLVTSCSSVLRVPCSKGCCHQHLEHGPRPTCHVTPRPDPRRTIPASDGRVPSLCFTPPNDPMRICHRPPPSQFLCDLFSNNRLLKLRTCP